MSRSPQAQAPAGSPYEAPMSHIRWSAVTELLTHLAILGALAANAAGLI